MDATTAGLVDFATSAHFSRLSQGTIHECKRRLIDTFACALGAYQDDLCKKARMVAERQSVDSNVFCRVWGSTRKTTPEAAAFANGVMLRVLDMNDLYRVKSGGHPSDLIAGVIAIGELVHADGPSVINAITLAYDVYCTLCEAVDLNSKGWDHPIIGGLACAIGAGKLLELSRNQMANAISLSLVPNMALFQTRRGHLSNWKGCAAANATRNGVFAALLAKDGFTGPEEPFEGKDGLWDIVGRFDWELPTAAESPHRVMLTSIKSFPICYHAQSGAWAALDLQRRIDAKDICDIRIETYAYAVEMCGSDISRWAPTTRDTADHSLPYVVAVALLDGEVTSDSFSAHRLTDAAIASLLKKIQVHESPQLSAQHPDASACKVSIVLNSGETISSEVSHPKGHVKNPLEDTDLDTKFRTMFRSFGDERQGERILAALWKLEVAEDINFVINEMIKQPH